MHVFLKTRIINPYVIGFIVDLRVILPLLKSKWKSLKFWDNLP